MARFKAQKMSIFSKNKVFKISYKLMNNFKNGLGEKPQIASTRSGTTHSTGFFPALNLKTEKKSFRP